MARDIDDLDKRRKYKASVYAGRESVTDEYTGMEIEDSDTDHITSIVKVKERFPGLTEEQLKDLANDNSNFAETNPTLNRSKGRRENHEYLLLQIKNGEEVDAGTAARMLSKELGSRASMRVKATGMYVENFARDGRRLAEENLKIDGEVLDAATEAALLAGTISVIRNVCEVSDGKKDGKDVAKDAAGTAVDTYSMKAISKGISKGLSVSDDTSEVLAAGTVQIAKSMAAYAKGEISYEQMQDEVAEKSGMAVAAYIGKNAGGFLGKGMGAFIGGVLVPGGEIAGAEAGCKIGEFVGEIITTAVCANMIEEIRNSRAFIRDTSRSISMANRAEREIRDSQARLREIIARENRDFQIKTDAGFTMMMDGILACDYARVSEGILKIGMKFGMRREELMEGTIEKGHMFDRVGDILEIC